MLVQAWLGVYSMRAYISVYIPLFLALRVLPFSFSSPLFAFIPLLNSLPHSPYYTFFLTEVKNDVAGMAEDRERETKSEAQSEKMKNKESEENRESEE